MIKINSPELLAWQAQAAADGRACLVGGLIVHAGRVFAQKRAPERSLFPGCWDIAGGQVQAGETFFQALEREIRAETGWQLEELLALVEAFDWEIQADGQTHPKREFDFLVRVSGDLQHPRLELGKFSEQRWIGPEDLAQLKENRAAGDEVVLNLVARALEMAG